MLEKGRGSFENKCRFWECTEEGSRHFKIKDVAFGRGRNKRDVDIIYLEIVCLKNKIVRNEEIYET